MPPEHVVFVCEHGAAKSVIAATEFNRLAELREAPVRAVARGTAPDPAIAPPVVEWLAREGVQVSGETPKALTGSDLLGVRAVVTFDQPQVAATLPHSIPVETWDGLPPVSNDFDRAHDAIRTKVEMLFERLAREASGRP
jgi:protein-tyrosine-phosphatase